MTLMEALENRNQYFDADIGYQLQRWVSFSLAGICGVASMTGMGIIGIVLAIWFLLSTLWPAAIGRVTAMLTILVSGVIIAMGDTTGNSLIQPLLALATLPMIFISALLASERFASAAAATGLYTYRKLLGREGVGV